MDDLPTNVEALDFCAPRLALAQDSELPEGFVPLRLTLHSGRLTLDLTKPEVLVGRHSEADIRLTLPDISRRHCRFAFADGLWRVFDLSSLNGLFVNNQRLQEAAIFHGDRIKIGSLTFEAQLNYQTIQGTLTDLMLKKAS